MWRDQRHWRISLLLFGFVGLRLAIADCECGYSTAAAGEPTIFTFTDLLESDFTRVADITASPDWDRPEFNKTKEAARGMYGQNFDGSNIVSFPATRTKDRCKIADDGLDAGLRLAVKKSIVDGYVPGAELDSSRLDIFQGSFRTSMKLSSTPGTCAAFFWVRCTYSCQGARQGSLTGASVLQRHARDRHGISLSGVQC
jgi:hypothetical protein